MSNANISSDRWMQSLNAIIKDAPLTHIALPGVHHPASYSFFTGNTGKYVTQNTTFYAQLMNGIRYFDSRPTVNKDNHNQLVEYHGSHQASFGASYNTILRQFKDYFDGYNTLVDFGSSPNVIPLADNRFAVIYHSERVTELSNDSTKDSGKSVFSTRLFYVIGSFNDENQKIKWQKPQPYNFGISPDATVTPSGLIVEVHQSQNQDDLYYTLGSIINGDPTFNLSNQEKYTEGQQPSIGQITEGELPCFLEVHKSQNNDTLWYRVLSPNSEYTRLKTLSSGKVSTPLCSVSGNFPTQVAVPHSNRSLVFYTDSEDIAVFIEASCHNGKVTFTTPVSLGVSGSAISAVLMEEKDGALQVALSVKNHKPTYTNRSYAVVNIDAKGALIDCTTTDFGNDYPSWNAETSALFYHTKSRSLLSFESDADLLSNIWYQPLVIEENRVELGHIDNHEEAKTEEFCILGLSHSQLNINTDLEYFQRLVKHILPEKIVPFDANAPLDRTPLDQYLKQQQQLLIVLDQQSSVVEKYPVFWPQNGCLTSYWHNEKSLNASYYKKIKQYAEQRTEPETKTQLYVLQTHLTSNSVYSQLLNWDYDYEPITNSYLASLTELLLDNNVNIIESNMLTDFLTGFAIRLNKQKFS